MNYYLGFLLLVASLGACGGIPKKNHRMSTFITVPIKLNPQQVEMLEKMSKKRNEATREKMSPVSVCPEQPEQRPMDCSEVLQSGNNKTGVYKIWPRSRISTKEPLSVYCDMDTDSGGWTVIQRRGNFSNPPDYFFKDWKSYKVGFGNLTEEFWLGNDNIFSISNQAKYKIRFDLEDAEGITGFAQYDQFWINNEVYNYRLHIKGYSGNVGDAMSRHDNMKFSTKDRDNDAKAGGSCAQDRQGAWWYESCTDAHLNGIYQPGVDNAKGIQWNTWRLDVSLAADEIKIKPH